MTTTQPTNLKPLAAGAVLQEGDFVQRDSAYAKHREPVHEHRDIKLHPIRPWTHGRVLLASDLMTAKYFRNATT